MYCMVPITLPIISLLIIHKMIKKENIYKNLIKLLILVSLINCYILNKELTLKNGIFKFNKEDKNRF